MIGKIQNSTLGASEKAQLMSQMFGEEGVRQVAKLTASIDGPLSDAIEDVSDAQIIDEDEEQRAKDLATQTRKLNTEWQNLKMTLGEASGPVPLAEETWPQAGRMGGDQRRVLRRFLGVACSTVRHRPRPTCSRRRWTRRSTI